MTTFASAWLLFLQNLNDLMQRRLHHLQNPKDCSSARKLVCSLDQKCGFGCNMHHALHCFIIAYALERTMILHSQGMCLKRVLMCELKCKELGVVCEVHRSQQIYCSECCSGYVGYGVLTLVSFWSTCV